MTLHRPHIVRPFRKLFQYLFNARSIVNKLCELHYLLYNIDLDICFITESRLHPDVNSGVLDPDGQFTVVRYDRREHTTSRGGGVCAPVSKRIRDVPVSIAADFMDLDIICFDLILFDT